MTLATLTPAQLRSVERTLSGGTWTITAGAVLFSVLTVTPLVQEVTPDEWDWSAPILPIVVDAAVVIVIRLDATVSRLGEAGGRWPGILRWLTGCMTLLLNVGHSALEHDLVGVAVHAVAPLLLIVTAEAALSYRRAITRALDRIARERREHEERAAREHREEVEREQRERLDREHREQAEREAREQAERDERERERAAREQAERDAREHELRKAREQRDAEREQRDWEADRERERAAREREEIREREERQRRDQEERLTREREERERQERVERANREREEQERRDQEAREQKERERREREREQQRQARREQSRSTVREHPAGVREQRPVPASRPPANTSKDKLSEADARAAVAAAAAGADANTGVRELARRTGWSVAWVSDRMTEAREQQSGEHPVEDAANTEQAAAGDLVGSGT